MAECYECGEYVAPGTGVRREVQTGRNSNVSFTSKGRLRHSSGSRYGKRTLCKDCAEAQDRASAAAFKFSAIIILAVLIVGIISCTMETEEVQPVAGNHNVTKECDVYGYPCQLDQIISSSDWDKIKSGIVFSAEFVPSPIDVTWENGETNRSGSIRFLSLDRDKCIFYEIIVKNGHDEYNEPITVCRNKDNSLRIE